MASGEKFEDKLKRLGENLIRISQISVDDKIKTSDYGIEVDTWYLTRAMWRKWSGDNQNTTRITLEKLYSEVFESLETIAGQVSLNRVMLPNKRNLTYAENKEYQSSKENYDTLTGRLEKSIAGLEKLDATYKQKETKIRILIDDSTARVKKCKTQTESLQRAYDKLEKLDILMDQPQPVIVAAPTSLTTLTSPSTSTLGGSVPKVTPSLTPSSSETHLATSSGTNSPRDGDSVDKKTDA